MDQNYLYLAFLTNLMTELYYALEEIMKYLFFF